MAFINGAFCMKRKTLVNNLKRKFSQPDIKKCFGDSALSPLVRAEALNFDTFVALFWCFQAYSDSHALAKGQ